MRGRPTSRSRPPDQAQPRSELQTPLDLVGVVAGLLAAIYLIGLIVTWVRFSAARLPGDSAPGVLGPQQVFGAGLRSTLLTAVVFGALSLLAYLISGFRWDVHGQAWHDVVRERGIGNALDRRDPARAGPYVGAESRSPTATQPVGRRAPAGTKAKPRIQAPLGDAGVRVIAGFNIMVLAGLASLAVARVIDGILPAAWRLALGSSVFLVTWAGLFIVFQQVLTRVGPLVVRPRWHGLVWAIVVAGALLASAPLGVLVLTGVLVSTLGRKIGRWELPRSLAATLRSPLPWVLLVIVTLLSLAYQAMPPVSFAGVSVLTPTGEVSGGYLNRTAAGVYLVTCTALADATSIDERVRLVRAADVAAVAMGGPAVSLDTGQRPSLITLGLRALGVDGAVRPLFNADLRPQRGTCGGANPRRLTAAREDPALGSGVIGPPPGGALAQAHDGEPTITQERGLAPIVALARRYQPALLVTVADRFWPVSVNALLADRGPHGGPTCLMQHRSRPVCGSQLTAQNLAGPGSLASDYLQFPVRLTHDPRGVGQFKAFQNGQYIDTGRLHAWLADPGRLHPWYTAQIYFLWGPAVRFSSFPTAHEGTPDPSGQQSFVPLEYWFYYPYNYFPLVTTSNLMNEAPLAADKFNVDLHQGDWEHIDVLLDATSLKPKWLYMARHSNEGQFIPWGSPTLALDDGHPLVQAAFGGHPTYEPGCGAQIRHQPGYVLVDWLVCGSGRFALPASSTPLVDIAQTPWACWPGHFGAAGTRDEIRSVGKPESALDKATGQLFVAGPQAPARQAENGNRTCAGSPRALERAAMARYFQPRAGRRGRRGPGHVRPGASGRL